MTALSAIVGRLRDECGEGMISALMLLGGVLVPLVFLVALFARIEQGRLAAAQAAQAAVRAAVQSPSADAAQASAERQLGDEQAQTHARLRLQLAGSFERGGIIEADVTGEIPVGHLPVLGDFGTMTVHATARAPVDRYRSLDGTGNP